MRLMLMEFKYVGDKFSIDDHGKTRTEKEAGCLKISSGVGQLSRQQSQIHFSERPEGASFRCHCLSGAIIDNPRPVGKTLSLLQSIDCTSPGRSREGFIRV